MRGASGTAIHELRGSRHNDPLRATITVAESMPRIANVSNQSGVLASAKLLCVAVPIEQGVTIGRLGMWIGTTALTRGSNLDSHAWLVLLDSSRVMLAQTADDTSGAVSANSCYEKAVATVAGGAASTFVTTYSGLHYVGLMINIGTGGSPAIPTLMAGSSHANITGEAPGICFEDSAATYTTPPAFAFTATQSSFKGIVPYARCRAS